jgi:hypothetical protein
MAGYGSHLPLLCQAVAWGMITHPNLRVLEVGGGKFSTPVLAQMCTLAGGLTTLEHSTAWYTRTKEAGFHRTGRTSLVPVGTIQGWLDRMKDMEPGHLYSVAFVDHEPNKERGLAVEALRDRAKIIVIHDTGPLGPNRRPWDGNAEDVLRTFPHRYEYDLLFPWTAAVSMTVDVAKEFG